MVFPEDKSRIERLKKVLYSREEFTPDTPIKPLKEAKDTEVPTQWQPPQEPTTPKASWPLVKILLWFSIGFFIIAAGIAGFIFYSGYNTVSADNVDVQIVGPTSVAGGRPLSLQVAIDNKNKVDLQNAYLLVTYPSGTRRDTTQTDELTHDRISIGTIPTGGHIDKTIQAVFFGAEGTNEKIQLSLEYNVVQSDTLYTKDKDFNFSLGQAPVTVAVSHVSEINSGQDVSFTVDVTSNSATPLSGLILRGDFPFGFTFKSATPKSSIDTNNASLWNLGDFKPGEKKTITITGKLEGQENEQRVFKFNVGLGNPSDARQIATVFFADSENVTIKKPFFGLDFTFNGSNVTVFSTQAGDTVRGYIQYANNLPVQVVDAVIQVKLNGAALNKSQVLSPSGFYQSADNTITWDKRQVSQLASLSAGQTGTIDFTFSTLPFSPGTTYSKSSQKVSLDVSMSGTRVSSTDSSERVTSSIARSVLVTSNVAVNSRALFYSGPFKNIGSMPPKAEKETTYTVIWSITNTFNNLSNVKVSATLPPNVKFLNQTSPAGEQVTYNPVSGTVEWTVGSVKANIGYGTSPRQAAFQVSLLPSVTQVGTMPLLLGQTNLTATDAYTSESLTASSKELNTELTTDAQFPNGNGTVVR